MIETNGLLDEDIHQLGGIVGSLQRYRRLEMLVGEIVATLNMERNKPHIDPGLLKIAIGWQRQFAKLGADDARCEYGVADGDFCESCNKEYKRAAKAAGLE
jgi:hypothetical protein